MMKYAVFALALVVAAPAAAATAAPQSMQEVHLTFAPVVKKVAPAVVNVYARSVVQQQVNPLFADPFFQQFFGYSPQMRRRVEQSLGSGVIVGPDGLVLTNNHVIAGASDSVVALSDQREFKAKVVQADPRVDLALLKIDTKGEKLPTVEFGNSDNLQVGDLVLAIGDPFGVGQTVTMGIVSALARSQGSASDYSFFIQTDAAINPGNSGGALVTTDGKLIGINSSIVSNSGGNIGIGFAIPANLAHRFVEGAGHGGMQLAWFGADGQPVTAEIASSLGMKAPSGVLLKDVYPGGPAAQAGLKVGDVVMAVDGYPTDDMQALNYRVAVHKPGDAPSVKVFAGGHMKSVTVKLSEPPAAPHDAATIGGRNPLTGAKVQTLSPAVAFTLHMNSDAKGVVVTGTTPNTPSSGYGFQAGDIIRGVNGQEIGSVKQLEDALNSAGGQWDLVIDRGGSRMRLSVSG